MSHIGIHEAETKVSQVIERAETEEEVVIARIGKHVVRRSWRLVLLGWRPWDRDRLGFAGQHHEEGFAALARDEAVLHVWQAGDDSWHERESLSPLGSGAESFLAGTASCLMQVQGVDGLFPELADQDLLHPVSKEGGSDTDFGSREFVTLDLDGNLLTFFEWLS